MYLYIFLVISLENALCFFILNFIVLFKTWIKGFADLLKEYVPKLLIESAIKYFHSDLNKVFQWQVARVSFWVLPVYKYKHLKFEQNIFSQGWLNKVDSFFRLY